MPAGSDIDWEPGRLPGLISADDMPRAPSPVPDAGAAAGGSASDGLTALTGRLLRVQADARDVLRGCHGALVPAGAVEAPALAVSAALEFGCYSRLEEANVIPRVVLVGSHVVAADRGAACSQVERTVNAPLAPR